MSRGRPAKILYVYCFLSFPKVEVSEMSACSLKQQRCSSEPRLASPEGCDAVLLPQAWRFPRLRLTPSIRQDNFLDPETAGWGGGLPREGVGVEKFVPSLESLSSLGLEGGGPWDVPGIVLGCPRPPASVQKVSAKKVRVHFSVAKASLPPKISNEERPHPTEYLCSQLRKGGT